MKKEYFEIRLESIGGLGANLCGKMLGELGVKYLNKNAINFSSYGSEKTGTPVKGHIRFCEKEKEIRVHSPVMEPDLLVIFHEALCKDASVWKGCNSNTSVIIALDSFEQEISIGECDSCFGVEAQKIAMETHSRINVVMLGAILKTLGLPNVKLGEQICRETLGKKYPEALQNNLNGMCKGFEGVRKIKARKYKMIQSSDDHLQWGYNTAPIGGINPHFGSTVIADLSPSRQGFIPLYIKEKCINCGLCFSTCPDMVFQFEKGTFKGREMMVNQGLDYIHCKGCLRCVDVCPVNALVRGKEEGHSRKEYDIPNKELLRVPKYYEESGPDGYITSESYLTEKRMEGGEV